MYIRKLGVSSFSNKKQFRVWFSVRLRERRKSFYLTQSDLADLLGVRQADISLFENGKTSPSLMVYLLIEDLFDRAYFSRSWNIQDIE